jgi:hypothetical protein
MQKLEYKKEMEVKNGLTVSFRSENVGVKINGTDESKFLLDWQLEGKYFDEESLKKNMKCVYNSETNEVLVDTIDVEDVFKISKSNLTIFLPKNCVVNAKTENGGLNIQNLQGNHEFFAENGAITLSKIEGNCYVKSENGAVFLDKVQGKLKIISENGAIKVVESSGTLTIENENGMLKILKSDFSKTNIRNENGAIYYEFLFRQKGEYRFENDNGKIHLVIPEELPYSIIAKNKFGNFAVGIAGNYDKRQENDDYVIEMVNGSGSVKIYAENENGSIRLMSESSAPFIQTVPMDTTKINKYFDKLVQMLPDEIQLTLIKEKLSGMKEKINNLNVQIPDMEKILQNTVQIIETEINKRVDKDALKNKGQEIVHLIKENLDEAFKKVEEKITDLKTKEVLQNEINQIIQQIEKVGDLITDEEQLKMLKEKFVLMKEKIKGLDISFPDFEQLFQTSIEAIENELEKHVDWEKWKNKGQEIVNLIKENLDEAFKKVEEKITDLKTKEVLQNEINQIIQQIEKVGDLITDEEQLKMLKEKFVLLKDKIKGLDISFPDFEHLFQTSIEAIENELEKHVDWEKWKNKGQEIVHLVKENVNNALEKIEVQMSKMELSDKERDMVDARSRLKILELVERKIINADEAERLIKAMEIRNTRNE